MVVSHYDVMAPAMSDSTAYRSWMCVVCGFIYNEEDGLIEEGIAPGTRWDEIPEDWVCPDCGVTKADFEMIEV
jgi:rubredoxin